MGGRPDLNPGRLAAVYRAAVLYLRPNWLDTGDRRDVYRRDAADPAARLARRRVCRSLGSPAHHDRGRPAAGRAAAVASAGALAGVAVGDLRGSVRAVGDRPVLQPGQG